MPTLDAAVFQRHAPYRGFAAASQGILKHLHQSYGMQLWMITRTEASDWIVLHAEDHGYGVKAGDVFNWSDSFCSRMVKEQGPLVAANSDHIEAYRNAPIGEQVQIGAYIGAPITRSSGELFGTLCSISPRPQFENFSEASLKRIESEICCHSRLLSTVLEYELHQLDNKRELERLQEESQRDPLTQLYNLRGWQALLTAEEKRCRDYGNIASVFIIDLDNLKQVNDRKGRSAGDAMLQRASSCISKLLPGDAIAARVGDDEFGILLSDSSYPDSATLALILDQELKAQNAHASIGFSMRNPRDQGLADAQQRAEQNMLAAKRQRSSAA